MTLYEALCLAFDAGKYSIPTNSKGITRESLLQFIASKQSTHKGAMGYSTGGWSKFIKKVFPDKPRLVNYYEWLLIKHNLKYCPSCNNVKNTSDFWNTKSNKNSGLQSYCIYCFEPILRIKCRSTTSAYRARKLQAVPKWADMLAIKQFYDSCPEGHHVDHIIPLAGKDVCGLHTLDNLQYLPATENLRKGNRI